MKTFLLGLQHVFVMAGATILVPMLTGIPVSVALFTSGFGTLVFHVITKRKVPVYLGSSFAYISGIIAVTAHYASQGDPTVALAYATGGVMVAGLVKIGFGILAKVIGVQKVLKLFPAYLYGTMIILIGLILAPVAIDMASSNWLLAIGTIGIFMLVALLARGFLATFPVLIAMFGAYIVALAFGLVNIQFPEQFMALPPFVLPRFGWFAISTLVPAALVAAVEHIGDVFAVSEIVGKDFSRDPGLHRTMMGDGLATSIAGFLGGPANTTYSENTGVLAITKQFNPLIMEIAAGVAIVLSFFPQVGAFISAMPSAIMGGVSIVLFGSIASVGMKSLIKNRVSVNKKQLIIMSVMLVSGIGGASITIGSFNLSGLGLAAVVGVGLNLLIKDKEAPELVQDVKKVRQEA